MHLLKHLLNNPLLGFHISSAHHFQLMCNCNIWNCHAIQTIAYSPVERFLNNTKKWDFDIENGKLCTQKNPFILLDLNIFPHKMFHILSFQVKRESFVFRFAYAMCHRSNYQPVNY